MAPEALDEELAALKIKLSEYEKLFVQSIHNKEGLDKTKKIFHEHHIIMIRIN